MRGYIHTLALGVALAAGCAGKGNEATPAPAAPAAPSDQPTTADYRKLPPPSGDGGVSLAAAIATRRSSRTYGNRKLTDAEIGQLLWAGQGITGEGRRAAPSAGALYPLTLYWADDVAVWQYVPAEHALRKTRDGDRRDELAAAALGQAQVKRAAGVIVVVARPAITAAKYGARAERYCTLEAGHAAQNILLTAAALDLGACPVGAFRDDAVLAAIGLDEGYEALYLLPVGEAFGKE